LTLHSAASPSATRPADSFRRCLATFTTGVAVVITTDEDDYAGMTVNSFTSVSLDPLLVSICLAHGSRTLELLRRAGAFTVSILRADQRDHARAFATPGASFPHDLIERRNGGGVYLANALATLDCRVAHTLCAGDHDVVIGRVNDFDSGTGEPLLFHRGELRELSPVPPSNPIRARSE
jgi:flavin reductase (DIM6/NTAB) family NADH-FMN oxidoreductase RutF